MHHHDFACGKMITLGISRLSGRPDLAGEFGLNHFLLQPKPRQTMAQYNVSHRFSIMFRLF